MPTAITRLNATVAAAVVSSSAASPRLERRILRGRAELDHAHRGDASGRPRGRPAGCRRRAGASASTTATRTRPWTIVETRVRAPARTLTAVRAMAPVAGMPPNSDTAMFARPWPTSSRSGSWSSPSASPSATLAESRLSSAASAATARTAVRSSGRCATSMSGRLGLGSPAGMVPIRAMGRSASRATSVATATAISEAGSERWSRGTTTITTTTSATTASASKLPPIQSPDRAVGDDGGVAARRASARRAPPEPPGGRSAARSRA